MYVRVCTVAGAAALRPHRPTDEITTITKRRQVSPGVYVVRARDVADEAKLTCYKRTHPYTHTGQRTVSRTASCCLACSAANAKKYGADIDWMNDPLPGGRPVARHAGVGCAGGDSSHVGSGRAGDAGVAEEDGVVAVEVGEAVGVPCAGELRRGSTALSAGAGKQTLAALTTGASSGAKRQR